jgi:hypothetical protein
MSEHKTRIAAQLMASPEIYAAVEWWANQLLGPCHVDAGDPTGQIEAVTMWAQNTRDQPGEHQIERFRIALSALTASMCAATSWLECEPMRGSACRTLGVDYGPDATLRCALDFAGIQGGNLVLPIKTVMWIDPGSVKVRCGYHGGEVVLWPPIDEATT